MDRVWRLLGITYTLDGTPRHPVLIDMIRWARATQNCFGHQGKKWGCSFLDALCWQDRTHQACFTFLAWSHPCIYPSKVPQARMKLLGMVWSWRFSQYSPHLGDERGWSLPGTTCSQRLELPGYTALMWAMNKLESPRWAALIWVTRNGYSRVYTQ